MHSHFLFAIVIIQYMTIASYTFVLQMPVQVSLFITDVNDEVPEFTNLRYKEAVMEVQCHRNCTKTKFQMTPRVMTLTLTFVLKIVLKIAFSDFAVQGGIDCFTNTIFCISVAARCIVFLNTSIIRDSHHVPIVMTPAKQSATYWSLCLSGTTCVMQNNVFLSSRDFGVL